MTDETQITEIATPRTIIGVSEEPADPKRERNLTTIQRQFIFQLFTHPAKAVAAIERDVGVSPGTVARNLKSIGCKLQPVLDEVGVTDRDVAVVIRDLLQADRMIVDKNGEEHFYPDHAMRARGAEMLARMKDMYPAKKLEIDDKRDRRNPLAGASMEALELVEGIMIEFSQNDPKPALLIDATQN